MLKRKDVLGLIDASEEEISEILNLAARAFPKRRQM